MEVSLYNGDWLGASCGQKINSLLTGFFQYLENRKP